MLCSGSLCSAQAAQHRDPLLDMLWPLGMGGEGLSTPLPTPVSGLSLQADRERGTHPGRCFARDLASHPGDAHLPPGADGDLLRLDAQILDSLSEINPTLGDLKSVENSPSPSCCSHPLMPSPVLSL